jgi:hypothetical protein
MGAGILQIRRGSDSGRLDHTFAEGEPVYTIDTKKLFVGDGSTPGGVEIGGGVFQIVHLKDEKPVGQYNSVNVNYVLINDFMTTDSVKVYLNGLPQREGIENDYTLVWPRLIKMNDPPFLGDSITVDYTTQLPTP